MYRQKRGVALPLYKSGWCYCPTKEQRFKTKVRPASNPVFNETFLFMYVDQMVVNQCQVRIRIYGQERYNQGRLIGELIQPLKELNLFNQTAEDNQVWKTLAPRALTVLFILFLFYC